MITLDYYISGKTGTDASTKDFDVSAISLTDLHYSGVFIGDVIIKDEEKGVDFSDYRGDHPILYFAEELFMISEDIATAIRKTYDYPDDGQELYFNRNGETIVITTNYTPGELVIELASFKEMTEKLLLKAYKNFCELQPKAINSPALQEVRKSVSKIS